MSLIMWTSTYHLQKATSVISFVRSIPAAMAWPVVSTGDGFEYVIVGIVYWWRSSPPAVEGRDTFRGSRLRHFSDAGVSGGR